MLKIYLAILGAFYLLMVSIWFILVKSGFLFPIQAPKSHPPTIASILPSQASNTSQNHSRIYWKPQGKPSGEVLTLTVTNYKGLYGQGDMRIIEPPSQAPNKAIFVFPGYTPNHDPFQQRPAHVVEKMGLRKFANVLNALIIVPKMNTSVYESNYYPLTSQKWDLSGNIPGGMWCNQILVDYITHTYFKGTTPSLYAVGISTGAQGAVKFGLAQPKYVKGVVGLSGTYDLLAPDGEPELHIPVFGDKINHRAIWQQESVTTHIPNMSFPIAVYSESQSFLTEQTRRFIQQLKTQQKSITDDSGNTIVPGSGHNWEFWSHKKVLTTIFRHIEDWK